jgi:hypothetical protein
MFDWGLWFRYPQEQEKTGISKDWLEVLTPIRSLLDKVAAV